MEKLKIKCRSTEPPIKLRLLNRDKSVIDLTNATSVKLTVADPRSGTKLLDAVAMEVVAPPTLGVVRYAQSATDFENPNKELETEVLITWDDETTTRVPSGQRGHPTEAVASWND
jgi:hypothetical protein